MPITRLTLPLELLLCVLDAVTWNNRKERAHVVQIALVCRAFYDHLKLRLYRVLVITSDNTGFFAEGNIDALTNVLPHVQSIHYLQLQDEVGYPELPALWANWTPSASAGVFFDLPWRCLKQFSLHPGFANVSGFDISYKTLEDAAKALRTKHSGVTVTHLVGYIPYKRYQIHNMSDWAAGIALGLPELTHLGLKIADVDEVEEDPQLLWEVYPVDNIRNALDVFRRDCLKLQCIRLRISGPMALCEPASTPLAAMLRELNDRRVTVSFESDPEYSQSLSPDDIWAGNDFWSSKHAVSMGDISR